MKIGIVPLVGGKDNRFEYIDIDDESKFLLFTPLIILKLMDHTI